MVLTCMLLICRVLRLGVKSQQLQLQKKTNQRFRRRLLNKCSQAKFLRRTNVMSSDTLRDNIVNGK